MNHQSQAREKRLKLKRIFSYLLTDRFGRKNKVADAMISNLHALVKNVSLPEAKNLLLTNCLQNYFQYRICSYENAIVLSSHLDLEKVSDLLSEIVNWERDIARRLKEVAKKKKMSLAHY